MEQIDILSLVAKIIPYLVPFLLARARDISDEFIKHGTKEIAHKLWDLLLRDKKYPELISPHLQKNGEIDERQLAETLRSILADNPQLCRQVNQILNVGEVSIEANQILIDSPITQNITNYNLPKRGGKGQAVAPFLPPDPYFAHQYGGASFTGRESEISKLTEWASQKHKPIMTILAIGGMGKSALAWEWTNRVLGKFDGVIWWSFYRDRFELFVSSALVYASNGTIDPAKIGYRDRVRKLLAELSKHNYLLILDGFELELRAYSGINAAYRFDDKFTVANDETVDENEYDRREAEYTSISTLSRSAQSRKNLPLTDNNELYDAIDPYAADFLTGLGTIPYFQSKVLITSRLFPRDLRDEGRFYRPNVEIPMELEGLSTDDALVFFNNRGIFANRGEVAEVCTPLGYHPLSLLLLAGKIANDLDPRMRNNFAAARVYVTDATIQQRHEKVLRVAFEDLKSEQKWLLQQISTFRDAISFEALQKIAGISDIRLKEGLNDLRDRGLLLVSTNGQCDLHPIVRAFAYRQLSPEERIQIHAKLRDYFSLITQKLKANRAKRIVDVMPFIELFHHTHETGKPDVAFEIFRTELEVPLFRLSTYQTIIGLLSSLDPLSENFGVSRIGSRDRHYVADMLAKCYSMTGQPDRAIPLFELSNHLVSADTSSDDLRSRREYIDGLRTLATMGYLPTAQLTKAAKSLVDSINSAHQLEDSHRENAARREMGRLFIYNGNLNRARELLEIARDAHERHYRTDQKSNDLLLAYCYLAELSIAESDLNQALENVGYSELAWKTLQADRNQASERDAIQIVQLKGVVERELEHSQKAEHYLNDGLARSRRINLVEFEATIMLELSRLRVEQEKYDEALRISRDALQIAQRANYNLLRADLHCVIAEIEKHLRNWNAAHDNARRALELARCQGLPYRYSRTLGKAAALLSSIKTKRV